MPARRGGHGGHGANEESWVDQYFKHPSYGPPDGTIVSLNDVEHRDHVEMLTEKLVDDDVKKRYKAAEALASYVADQVYLPEDMEVHPAEVLASAFMKAIPDRMFCISAARSLAIMGEYAAPYASLAVTKVLRHAAADLRYEAMVALRRFGPLAARDAAGPLAVVVLEDEEARLRREALKALAALGPATAPAAGKAMAQACQDEDTDVQVSAIKCMAVMGPAVAGEVAGPAIFQVLENGSQEMRRFAMESIMAIGPSVAPHVSKAVGLHLRPLPDSDAELRYLAVRALEAMGPDIVYEQEVLLSRALKDPEEEVREQAWSALRDANCVKGMMGSMALEERIFPKEVLEGARKLETASSDEDGSDAEDDQEESEEDDSQEEAEEDEQARDSDGASFSSGSAAE